MNDQTHNRDDSQERTNLLCSLAKEKVTNHGEGKEKMRCLLNLGGQSSRSKGHTQRLLTHLVLD